MRLFTARAAKIWILPAAALVIGVMALVQVSGAADPKKETYESLKLFSDVLYEIENSYVDEVDADTLIHDAIQGMVENLDPHSTFMPPEAFDELQDDTKGEFGGIGIVISMKKGLLTVVSPIEGTPAYEAGILAGDVIIRIDEADTADMALWECVKRMRGPRGEPVDLTILREGEPEPLEYTLVRDMIPMTSVRSTMVHPGYGYVWVTNFRNNTAEEIQDAIKALEKENAPLKGVILDLRNNPGGLLDQAVKVSDLFIDDGVIVSIKGRIPRHNEVFEAHPEQSMGTWPMAVIINAGSASASEIVAGALQDHGRAVILGTTSFGKGSVQTVKPLKDGYGLKYTIARYYTPKGRSIQAQGIIPDIEVPFQRLESPEKDTEESVHAMAEMLREKDLKNHLMPEKNKKKPEDSTGEKKEAPSPSITSVDPDRLKRDGQVKRALDILIGYSVLKHHN